MDVRSAFLYASVLSAAFGIIWLPMLMRQPKAFVSPYSRADIRKRAWAATADGLLLGTCVLLYLTNDSILFIAAGAVYLLLRDALFIPGQSVGKFLFGLRVISLENGRPCGRWHSARRNFILIVPGMNVVAAVLETFEIARDTQGQRLGDRLANTQVVEGLSAKELATSLQRALLEASAAHRGEKEPVVVKT